MPTTVARLLAILLLAAAALVAAPAPLACACSCAQLDTDGALQNATAVFDGTVVWATPQTERYTAEPVFYTIAVSRVYKGDVAATVMVQSPGSGASCGVELKGQVTVFAEGSIGDLRTYLCSSPDPLDRSRLGEGRPPAPAPTPATPEAPAPTDPNSTLHGWTLAGLILLAGLAIWYARRSGR